MDLSAALRARLPTLLDYAARAAKAGAGEILSGFRNPGLVIERKADNSVVTPHDREAERQIRAGLALAREAEAGILGEELGEESGGAPLRWLIDPIDGTLSYTRGIPLFGTLVALDDTRLRRGLLGVIHLPVFGETYSAYRGGGAHCDGKPITVSSQDELRGAMVSVSSVEDLENGGLSEGYQRLLRTAWRLRSNSDCWTHAMTARGAIDAVIELSLNRWDIAATEVIIEEAGGRCITRTSRTIPHKVDTIFGNARLVDELARVVGF
jgi:histidinol phosphatase-like enzyme (inositol monophosphatase family)